MTSTGAALLFAALLAPTGPASPRTTPAGLQAGPPPGAPRPLSLDDVGVLAIMAVEGDSADAVRARWDTAASTLTDPRVAGLGGAYIDMLTYRYPEADRALAALLASARHDDPLRPHLHLAAGEGALLRGQYGEAEKRFTTALRGPGPVLASTPRALALIRLATILGRVEGVATLLALLDEAAPLIPPDDGFLTGSYRCARAGRNGTGTAREDAEAGAALAREAGVKRLHANCLMLVGQDHHQTGSVRTALLVFDAVQREQDAARDHTQRAATLQWMGYVLLTVGDYDVARRRLVEAVAEGERSGNQSAVAWAYLNLAAMSNSMGDLESSLSYLRRAEARFQAQDDQWGLASARSTRAEVSVGLSLWDSAQRDYTAARDAALASRDRAGSIGNQLNLATVAMGRGDMEAAESAIASAHELARTLNMPGWRFSVLAVEADLALRKGDPVRALAALDEYLDVTLTPVRRYRALARYAEALAATGRVSEAADTFGSALSQLERWRSTLDPAGLRRYAFQVRGSPVDPDLGVATLIAAMVAEGQVEKAFHLSERQRARTLLERLVRARAVQGGRPVDSAGPGVLTETPLAAESVEERLPAGTALVAYVTGVGGEPTTAFLVQQSGTLGFVLAPADTIALDVARYLGNIRIPGVAAGLASRLGTATLGPLLAHLEPGVTTLVIVPDGPLHRLPFSALRLPDGSWLGSRYVVSVAPSATTSLALNSVRAGPAPARPPRILSFGDPALGGESFWAALPEGIRSDAVALPPLPGAAREARRVARFSRGGEARIGGAATEASFRLRHGNFNVLHFASHALVGGASDDRVGLLLAPGGGSDGLLGPGDLASMDMSGTQLVFLSSCQTTSGLLLRGEGLQGMTAPLLSAGVRTVIATAWLVDDATAGSMAERFYRGLAAGLTTGEALRQAQMDAADDGMAVADWGAFVLLGDAELRIPLRRPLPIGGLALAGLASALFVAAAGLRRHRRRPAPA